MLVHDNTDCIWLIWPPFSGWLKKFRISEIIYLASPRDILEPPSVVFSVCKKHYQKLECLWQMHKLQFIHKLVLRCDHLNISTMYTIFDWKEFELLSYRWAFSESTKISASEETNGLEKVPVQIMLLWKLSGKFHFLVRFYTSNWKRTYLIVKYVLQDVKMSLYQRSLEVRTWSSLWRRMEKDGCGTPWSRNSP